MRSILLSFITLAGVFAQTADKPADTTKIFGPPPPARTDKQLLRTVMGTVKDADGNPVPGALVYLKEVDGGKERSVVADNNGRYRFEDLHKKYDYQLRAAKDKLASHPKTLSNFDTRPAPVMNLVLETAPAKADAGRK